MLRAGHTPNRPAQLPPGDGKPEDEPGGSLRDELAVSSTAMESASWSASSRYCVVRKIVTPPATRSPMICHMVWRLRGSRPVVGSSRKMIRGLPQGSSRGRVGVASRRSRWRAISWRRRPDRTTGERLGRPRPFSPLPNHGAESTLGAGTGGANANERVPSDPVGSPS